MLVGSRVRAWTLVWPKGPQCRCLVWFRGFVGVCGLHGESVVPHGLGTQDVGDCCGFGSSQMLVGSGLKVVVSHMVQGLKL